MVHLNSWYTITEWGPSPKTTVSKTFFKELCFLSHNNFQTLIIIFIIISLLHLSSYLYNNYYSDWLLVFIIVTSIFLKFFLNCCWLHDKCWKSEKSKKIWSLHWIELSGAYIIFCFLNQVWSPCLEDYELMMYLRAARWGRNKQLNKQKGQY